MKTNDLFEQLAKNSQKDRYRVVEYLDGTFQSQVLRASSFNDMAFAGRSPPEVWIDVGPRSASLVEARGKISHVSVKEVHQP